MRPSALPNKFKEYKIIPKHMITKAMEYKILVPNSC
jgi:hypothetical protein